MLPTTNLLAGQIWAPYTPGYLRQSGITPDSKSQPLVHPSPQIQAIPLSQETAAELPPGQAISRSRPPTSRASTSRASARSAKRLWECPECGRKCRDSWTLKDHRFNHSELREHGCSDCGKLYKRPRDLKTHTNKKSCSSTSQVDASSERGRTQFHIQTPRSYPRCISGNGNGAMILDDQTHKPLLFDKRFLSDSRYEESDTLPQPTMDELDSVPQGGDVGPDVVQVLALFDSDFTQTYCGSPEEEPVNRQPEAIHPPHNTVAGEFSTGLNSRYGAGNRFISAISAPSFSAGTGSLSETEMPPFGDGTDSESPPSSSLNTSESQQNANIVQQLQADDQSSSTDRRSYLSHGVIQRCPTLDNGSSFGNANECLGGLGITGSNGTDCAPAEGDNQPEPLDEWIRKTFPNPELFSSPEDPFSGPLS